MIENKILVVGTDLGLLKRARISLADASKDVFTAIDLQTAVKILESGSVAFQSLYLQNTLEDSEKKELIWLAHKKKLTVHEMMIDKMGNFLIN